MVKKPVLIMKMNINVVRGIDSFKHLNRKNFFSLGITKCNIDSWLCKNGTCIGKSRLCNGHKDCPDGSDEGDICHSHLCGPNNIHCPTGECIPESKVKEIVYIFHCS
jgi:hypothetical protein